MTMFGLAGFVRSLETIIDQVAVESIKRELLTSASRLDGGRFQNLTVSPAIFGGSQAGAELGTHHERAHQVIAETIEGVIADLRDFRDGVVRAEQMLESADTGAASDLDRGRSAVEQLVAANRSFDGDRRYDAARNQHTGQGEA